MDTVAVLKRAYQLLEPGFSKHFFRRRRGEVVLDWLSKKPKKKDRFCIRGALIYAYCELMEANRFEGVYSGESNDLQMCVAKVVSNMTHRPMNSVCDLAIWNNSIATHEDILAVMRQAIEYAQAA